MKELISITNHGGKKAVSARVLYDFLGFNVSQWKRWYTKNILNNQFAVENEDYVRFDLMSKTSDSGGRPTMDFALSIPFAKKIAMQAHTEKGNAARDYFLECEKQLQQSNQPLSQLQILQQSVQMLVEQEKRLESVENEVKLIKAQTTTQPDYFTVAGYGTLKGLKVPLQIAVKIGNYASKKCKQLGIMMGECPDPRFGKVRTYPTDILEEAFLQTMN